MGSIRFLCDILIRRRYLNFVFKFIFLLIKKYDIVLFLGERDPQLRINPQDISLCASNTLKIINLTTKNISNLITLSVDGSTDWDISGKISVNQEKRNWLYKYFSQVTIVQCIILMFIVCITWGKSYVTRVK